MTLETCSSQDDGVAQGAWFMLCMYERNYPEALDQVARTSAPLSSWFSKTELAGYIYTAMGEPVRARECFDSARIALENDLKERPDDYRLHSRLGYVYAGLGQDAAAIREGKLGVELMPVSKDAYLGPVAVEDLASIYVMVSEYDAALDQIEYLLSIPGELSVSILRLDPRYDPLRKLPRFQKLLQQPDKVF